MQASLFLSSQYWVFLEICPRQNSGTKSLLVKSCEILLFVLLSVLDPEVYLTEKNGFDQQKTLTSLSEIGYAKSHGLSSFSPLGGLPYFQTHPHFTHGSRNFTMKPMTLSKNLRTTIHIGTLESFLSPPECNIYLAYPCLFYFGQLRQTCCPTAQLVFARFPTFFLCELDCCAASRQVLLKELHAINSQV